MRKNHEIYEKSGGFGGLFITFYLFLFIFISYLITIFITLYDDGLDGIRRGHVEIEFGKNSKAKRIHAH